MNQSWYKSMGGSTQITFQGTVMTEPWSKRPFVNVLHRILTVPTLSWSCIQWCYRRRWRNHHDTFNQHFLNFHPAKIKITVPQNKYHGKTCNCNFSIKLFSLVELEEAETIDILSWISILDSLFKCSFRIIFSVLYLYFEMRH